MNFNVTYILLNANYRSLYKKQLKFNNKYDWKLKIIYS